MNSQPPAPNRQRDLVACVLVFVLYIAVGFIGGGRADWLGSVRRDYPDALMWLPATNDISAGSLILVGAMAFVLYFILPGSKRPRRLLGGAFVIALALGALSLWTETRAGIAVYDGPLVIRAAEPWTPDLHTSLTSAGKVVAGCVTDVRAGKPTDRFLIYHVTLKNGRDVRLSDADPRGRSAAIWIAVMNRLAPFLDAPRVVHVRHNDGAGQAYLTKDCLDFFHAKLSAGEYADLLRILRVTPAELAQAEADGS